ncbi:hypothetical protein OV450_3419 [Actinobacteria bacterium OV450]|nr:hypothetical protein OV450_3419 [Actinobacteria bacterium OV450]
MRVGHFVIDVTAVTSSPSVVFTVSGVDRASGQIYTLLASAAVTGTGTTVLRIDSALTGSANLIAKDTLPPVIRVTATHGNSNSITYSVGAAVM